MAPTVPTASSSPSNATSVQVAVRIRPPTTHDASSIPSRFQRTVIHASSPTTVTVDNATSVPPGTPGAVAPPPAPSAASNAKKSVFAFDQVHAPETTQFELYNTTASPLVSRFIEGFNCTILAYGQTSSGKTYSMTGIDLDANPSDSTNGMGIIPRAVSTIFSKANDLKRERGGSWQWSIKASFIEIYNEDLIDLLAIEEAGGARRDVQIREDKDGNIIWGGLREIPVRSAADVMAILIRGTALRRTNETDMNAQSSRSHAIFSITLTQKKFSGSSSPSRTGRSSPMPSNGSPSRLIRPGSMYAGSPAARVSSPTFGRSPTPSFAAAMSRANGNNTRPASSLGMRPRSPEAEDGKGDWTTVVSKFHFVDLAGSERLKRTAAAGDRIKEGISINGGLLALGNVISALGDPSRARTLGHGAPIHVPYRDSKLTRLLQDSLGGNAHTLMIACVSPAEWNLGETINTLKYANRARNIKNRAEIREKEDGWDDLEWLQSMVTKLRKELKALKEGGPSSLPTDIPEEETPAQGSNMAPDRAGGKVLKQYGELQSMYRELRKEYVERNEELARLRRELEDKTSPSVSGGGARYEEIVGPVIEEYEKTITAMEAELKLSRTALEHTNEMYAEQENELLVYKERNANADGYIEALRARVSKLLEREASTESYIRDLEAKLKASAESSTSTDDSVADLLKEIARHKEAEASSSTYIAALEHRLTRADVDVGEFRAQIEKLEIDLEQKNEALDTLQGRLDVFLSEQDDARNWKKTLDEREKRVQELELKMQEWEKVRVETSQERERLGGVVQGVTKARRSLEVEGTKKNGDSAPPKIHLGDTTPTSPAFSIATIKLDTSSERSGEDDELLALQKAHSDTLVELESVTSKYRDALREIADLAAQISEAKLQSDTSSEVGSDTGSSRFLPRTPRRGITRRETVDGLSPLKIPPSPISVAAAPSRRNLFRHAASSEGLHSRSQSQSQSLSQELYSPPHSRTSWALGDSLLSPGALSSKGFVKREFSQDNVRSAESLEKEIHRLQEVLKDRETEISMLEKSLAASAPEYFPTAPSPASINPLPDVKEESDLYAEGVTPTSINSRQAQLLDEQQREAERKEAESISRLDELMRSMAQKESQHVAVVDHLNDELGTLRKQHEDLAAASRDQAEEHSNATLALSTELEQLRSNISTAEDKQRELSDELQKVQAREAELLEARRIADETRAREISELLTAHAAEVQRYNDESAVMLNRHQTELEALKSGHANAERAHEEALKQSIAEHNAFVDQTREAHAGEISKLKSDHESRLQEKLDEADAALESARAVHEEALAAALAEREEALRKHMEEAEEALSRLREDHAAELKRADIAREGTLTESQSRQAAVLQELQDEHQATLDRKEAAFKADLEKAKAEHQRLVAAQEEVHSSAITKLQSEHAQRSTELEAALEAANADHSRALEAREAEFLDSIEKLNSDHAAEVDQLDASKSDEIQHLTEALVRSQEEHQASSSALRSGKDAALAEAADKHQTAVQALRSEHDATLGKLKEEHEASIVAVQASLSAVEETHRQGIASLRQEHEARLEEERQQQTSALTELDEIHNEERETLRKAHDLLEDEVIGLKAAAAKSTSDFARLRLDHEGLRAEKDQAVLTLERELASVKQEHSAFAQTIQDLHNELETARQEKIALAQDVSKRESLANELDRHRSILGETQTNLQRTKDEMDSLRQEKNRQDQVLRELQAQLAATKSQRSPQEDTALVQGERVQSHRIGNFSPVKLPPLTPPPSIPPPPIPGSIPPVPSLPADASVSSTSRSSRSSHGSLEDSTSGRSTPSTSILLHTNGIESKLQSQLVEQNRLMEEQETMIKTLNKQLTHCESDLQAHMDLVATLETSLTDSERNLRKTRMQANEYAKERDTLNAQIESLRSQLQTSQQEIISVRRSVVEEKQSFESRLEEERRQKERTRAQLDSRMEELQKRKSKYVCL